MISETKLDGSFPAKQFLIDGFSLPYRFDKSNKSGGILLYVREDIPSKALKTNFKNQGIFVEINLKKRKWLIFGGYNPHKDLANNYLSELSTEIDKFIIKYDNLIIMGDFNIEINDSCMAEFCE